MKKALCSLISTISFIWSWIKLKSNTFFLTSLLSNYINWLHISCVRFHLDFENVFTAFLLYIYFKMTQQEWKKEFNSIVRTVSSLRCKSKINIWNKNMWSKKKVCLTIFYILICMLYVFFNFIFLSAFLIILIFFCYFWQLHTHRTSPIWNVKYESFVK